MALLRQQIEDFLMNTIGIDEYYFKSFEFHVGGTPFSHIMFPFGTIFFYCIGIPLLQRFMENRKSPNLKGILIVHNLFLSAISFFMAIFLLTTVISFGNISYGGYTYHQMFCSLNHHDQRGTLTFLYFINYLLKYYELLDTIFLVLKHRPVSFLHGYHHPATLALTWGQLVDSTGIQWIIIFLNLCVHTVMYFYYFIMAAKLKFLKPKSWKMLVTLMQITQFVIDLSVCYYACFANRWFNQCVGTVRSAIIGLFILTSYLYLFVDFFADAYQNKAANVRLPAIWTSLLIVFVSSLMYILSTVIDPLWPHLNFYR